MGRACVMCATYRLALVPPTAAIVASLATTPERAREVALGRRLEASHAALAPALRNLPLGAARRPLLLPGRPGDHALSYPSSVCTPHTSRPRLTFLCPPLRGGRNHQRGSRPLGPALLPQRGRDRGRGAGGGESAEAAARGRRGGEGAGAAARGADERRRRGEGRRHYECNTLTVRTLCLWHASLIQDP
jgi:hypothetical protein